MADPPPAWAIETEGLSKSFGYTHALSNVDLQVKRGSRLTIFGPNGAGKTTLVKVLSTLSKPSGGNARVDGFDIRSDPVQVRCRLGVVTHSTFLYDDLTVNENLRFYGKMYRIANLEQRLEEVTSQMQLGNCLHARVGTLSHGMQRRVTISRAVLHNPSILLLDEPEIGLDPHATEMVREMLDMLNSGERTVVMTTHNLERGLESANYVVILHEGRIVYQALKQDIDAAGFREVYDRCTG